VNAPWRIGHLYPSGGLCEDEMPRMAPPGVRFHVTRMPFRGTSLHDDRALLQDLEAHAQLLADARVDLIAVNCTAATMLAGPEAVNARVTGATGIPSVTTIEAVLAALAATRMRRLLLLTPYPAEVVEEEIAYLQARGHEVVAAAGTPCATPWEQGNLQPESWIALARQLADREADGLLLSCAGVPVAGVLARMETILGRPVVTSNQALLWRCLRLLGVNQPQTGFGALLEGRHG